MEENNKKRVRVDSDPDEHEPKRVHVDPKLNSDESRVDPVIPEFDNDILDILDDPDCVTDRDPEIQDLDSVIRSFEEEILQRVPADISGETPSDISDDSQPDLGYLLEASDDELGLPPAVSPTEDKTKNDVVPSYDSFGFDNEIPCYDSFAFGFGLEAEGINDVAARGLFEYSDESDFSEFLWRPESLPAV